MPINRYSSPDAALFSPRRLAKNALKPRPEIENQPPAPLFFSWIQDLERFGFDIAKESCFVIKRK